MFVSFFLLKTIIVVSIWNFVKWTKLSPEKNNVGYENGYPSVSRQKNCHGLICLFSGECFCFPGWRGPACADHRERPPVVPPPDPMVPPPMCMHPPCGVDIPDVNPGADEVIYCRVYRYSVSETNYKENIKLRESWVEILGLVLLWSFYLIKFHQRSSATK